MKRLWIAILLCSQVGLHAQPLTMKNAKIHEALAIAREKYGMPAMGVAVISDDTLAFLDVLGVRKLGDTTREEVTDLWHLGSDTKAVTAAAITRLVQSGVLSYTSTFGQIFPELRGKILPVYDTVTLEMLLEHRAGLWHDWPETFTRDVFDNYRGSLRDRRLKFLTTLLAYPSEFTPGSKYSYSNTGYVIAAAMAERAANAQYETLVDSLIFRPLGISSAGWGLMNTRGKTDNTWEHEYRDSTLTPVDNILHGDFPELINPVARLHLTLEDWSKFIRLFLPGSALQLPGINLSRLNDALPSGNEQFYRDGWVIARRRWAGGIALNHSGSNSLNFANVWVAPNKHFAVMVTVNAFNDAACQAAEAVIDTAITEYAKP